jgi:hypothetical protein
MNTTQDMHTTQEDPYQGEELLCQPPKKSF